MYGCSPVCVRAWYCKLLHAANLRANPRYLQMYGVSPVCVCSGALSCQMHTVACIQDTCRSMLYNRTCMGSHPCAFAYAFSSCSSGNIFARIRDNCKYVVSALCACVHGASNCSIAQTFTRILDNCRCMVSHQCAFAHGLSSCPL